jgi:predicted esterase
MQAFPLTTSRTVSVLGFREISIILFRNGKIMLSTEKHASHDFLNRNLPMNSNTLLITAVLLAVSHLPLSAREWINDAGQKIEADFISADANTVTLRRNGKEIIYPLNKLSQADRDFIKLQPKPPAPAAAGGAKTGWNAAFPIKAAHADPKAYLAHGNAKAVYRAFDAGNHSPEWTTNKKNAALEFSYDESKAAIVYVPASYDGSKPYGIYLHVSPANAGARIAEYAPVMDRLNLIYVSPNGTSNNEAMLRRVKISVDAVQSVMATHRIDSRRVCAGGVSGGGHMAMMIHSMFPGLFMGSVSHAAQSYLPKDGASGHFPGLEANDLKSGDLRNHKWCVISGNKDYNYPEILKTSKDWQDKHMNYKFFDIPDMGHTNAPAASLEEALKWLGM